jgi:hypothetical protein
MAFPMKLSRPAVIISTGSSVLTKINVCRCRTLWVMTPTLAASDDTWGITGPLFLRIYAGLFVAALVAALTWRYLASVVSR